MPLNFEALPSVFNDPDSFVQTRHVQRSSTSELIVRQVTPHMERHPQHQLEATMSLKTVDLGGDAKLYIEALSKIAPTSYGGVAAVLGWDIGRAALAAAEVGRAGLLTYDNAGRGRLRSDVQVAELVGSTESV